MSEKGNFRSRLLSYLVAMSLFLLILSSLFLLRFRGNNSSVPTHDLILVNVNATTSSYLAANAKTDQYRSRPNSPSEELGAFEVDRRKPCDASTALLRVFVYDLPPEFHFGLLGWMASANQTWPDVGDPDQIPSYPGGLNLQHSVEYWMTLDLLSSKANVTRPCTAFRVHNSKDADIIFVPFFASLSYNRHSKGRGSARASADRTLQNRLVDFLMGRAEWRRSGGKDHLVVAHHPNSLLVTRNRLGSARFVLADFGRYSASVANVKKDVIAPYRHVVGSINDGEFAPFEERPILAYFQGAIYRKDGGAIRQELYYLLKDEPDVHFAFGSIRGHGARRARQGMGRSKFCLHVAGDTPSSSRLFDAIATQCVPVVISDQIELPYEDVLDYSEFCVFVRASDAVKRGYMTSILRGIDRGEWTKMRERLKEVGPMFEYRYPSRAGDAVDMIWQAVHRKISSAHNDFNRKNRYRKCRNSSEVR